MENEIWKDIPGYEGIYQASNLGKIRSLNYKQTGKTMIMTPLKYRDGDERTKVYLHKSNIKTIKGVYVAVWEAFNGKTVPEGYVVHHINHDPSDNRIENLECMSRKKHMQEHHNRAIVQLDINGNFIAEYSSITEAAEVLGKSSPGLIGKVLTGKRNKTYNSKWMYAEDYYNKSMQ